MARIRLYVYSTTPYVRYDTGVYDDSAPPGAGCLNPDAQQFTSLQDLLAYAQARGETVRYVSSVEEVNAICGGGFQSTGANQPYVAPPTSTCTAGVCGPGGSQPSSPLTTQPTGGQGPTGQSTLTSGGAVTTTTTAPPTAPAPGASVPGQMGAGVPSPSSGQLPGTIIPQSVNPQTQGPIGTTPIQAGAGVTTSVRFNLTEFVKSPMFILLIVLLVLVAILTR